MIKRPNFGNLFRPKFGCSRLLASRRAFRFRNSSMLVALRLPVFIAAIGSVVLGCSQKEMIWPYAQRGVAMMANFDSGWNVPESYLPRETVSAPLFCFNRGASWSELPISIASFSSSPKPAVAKLRPVLWNRSIFINVAPKELDDADGKCDSLARFDVVAHIVFSGGRSLPGSGLCAPTI